MTKRLPGYQAYLLRLWCSGAGEAVWHASLEDPEQGVRRGFATLEHLFTFLRDQANAPATVPAELERGAVETPDA